MATATRTRKPKTTPANPVLTAEAAATLDVPAPVTVDVPAAPAEPTIEEQVMEVKQNWMLAGDAEAAGKKGVQAAKRALNVARVLKSRVAFHAAALGSRANDGTPSLKGATRVLYCTADMSAGEAAKQVENKKASVRLYWAAAQALDKEGYAFETGDPTDAEIEICLEAFKAGKTPRNPKPNDGTGNGEGDGENGNGATPPADVEVTADSFLPMIAGLNQTLTAVKAKKVPVSQEQAADIAAMVKAFTEQLTAYVGS